MGGIWTTTKAQTNYARRSERITLAAEI